MQRTFSEDLSVYPIKVTMRTEGVNGLHEAIQQRLAGIHEAHLSGRGYQTPESVTLEYASGELAKFNATDIQEAA